MNSKPENLLVEWKLVTRYIASSETDIQFVKVSSMEEAKEVATNIRDDASYIDVSQGIIHNSIEYIRVYKLDTPVEL